MSERGHSEEDILRVLREADSSDTGMECVASRKRSAYRA